MNKIGVEFLALNTDAQHLSTSLSPNRLQIGAQLTSGLGEKRQNVCDVSYFFIS